MDTQVYQIHELIGEDRGLRSCRAISGQVHLVTEPDEVEQALHLTCFERSELIAKMAGNGLIFSDGPNWLEYRRLTQPLFHERVSNSPHRHNVLMP